MSTQDIDTGIIQVVLQRLENERLPRMIEIMHRLEQGETLYDYDIMFLSQSLQDARELLPYLDRHTEYEPLFSKVIHYYKMITDKALDNESK